MNKTQFIQNVIIRSLPKLEKLSDGVVYAEHLWQGLTDLGYGAPSQRKTVEKVNYYEQLSQYQRDAFDRFWTAFNHKHGRNNAAKEWQKLGEPSQAHYDMIIAAAKQEAAKSLPNGQSRKMAEGWLSDFRYEDNQPSQATEKKHDQEQIQRRQDIEDLKGCERLYEMSPTPSLEQQIKDLKHKLNIMEKQQ